MDKGYILLSRNLLDSDVFASQKLLKIWIWCLCKANFKDRSIPLKIGKGEIVVKVDRGSFIFGRHKAEEELFIDGSTIYKSINKLKEMGMIDIKSNNQYSIVTINKYDTYQDNENYKVTTKEQPKNNQRTSKEQPSNTTNTLTNDTNDTNNINSRKLKFAESLEKFSDIYPKEMISDFYEYWTEPNKANTKFKQEMQLTWSLERRLKTWDKNNFNKNKNGTREQPLLGRQTASTVRANASGWDSIE